MCPFTVRVTCTLISLADFLEGRITSSIARVRKPRVLSAINSERVLHYAHLRLPAFNAQFRLRAGVSLPCHRITVHVSNGILTVSTIGLAIRLILRTRLTPGRLALPGKPWPFGGRASHPPYRYLCLHLRFHKLQYRSPYTFSVDGMLPYRRSLVPRLRQAV